MPFLYRAPPVFSTLRRAWSGWEKPPFYLVKAQKWVCHCAPYALGSIAPAIWSCLTITSMKHHNPNIHCLRTEPSFIRHPVPGPCKWLKHVLKLLVCIFKLGGVVLVSRSNISKICGQKFEQITNNWKITILGGSFCTSRCPHPAEGN